MSDTGRNSPPRTEDDPLQTLIGQQLKSLYDSVLSEPIPERFVELLAKLDEIPAPDHRSDGRQQDDQ